MALHVIHISVGWLVVGAGRPALGKVQPAMLAGGGRLTDLWPELEHALPDLTGTRA